jgi:hypothetical protein
MRNPKTVTIAQFIAEAIPSLVVDRDGNVLTLEDTVGDRYLVTVESMFTATDAAPLPNPEEPHAVPMD